MRAANHSFGEGFEKSCLVGCAHSAPQHIVVLACETSSIKGSCKFSLQDSVELVAGRTDMFKRSLKRGEVWESPRPPFEVRVLLEHYFGVTFP